MALEQEMTMTEMQEVVFTHSTVNEFYNETHFAF